MNNIKKLISKPLFLPIFCMLLVMAVNIIYDVASGNFAFNFFTISIRNGVLYGRIIDILNRGSEIAILAIGMTLVLQVLIFPLVRSCHWQRRSAVCCLQAMEFPPRMNWRDRLSSECLAVS